MYPLVSFKPIKFSQPYDLCIPSTKINFTPSTLKLGLAKEDKRALKHTNQQKKTPYILATTLLEIKCRLQQRESHSLHSNTKFGNLKKIPRKNPQHMTLQNGEMEKMGFVHSSSHCDGLAMEKHGDFIC
jgi:hypothetical protein